MRNPKKLYLIRLFVFAFVVMLYSCAEEMGMSPMEPMPVDNILDIALTDAIEGAPNSTGISSYILPDSEDYGAIPQDPRNPITSAKVELGKFLFHETAFGTKAEMKELIGSYSCASCHHAAAGFQAGTAQGIGEGGMGFGIRGESRMVNPHIDESKIDVQPLRSPSAMNVAYQTNMLWNGQFGATALNDGTDHLWPEGTPIAVNVLGYEGVEIQAIAGYGVHRHAFDKQTVIANRYQALFDQAFSDIPEDERYTVEYAGLAVAAYERTLLANKSPFQQWLRGNTSAMTNIQKEGAVLFLGKGQCASCHGGPSLANMEFHAIGMRDFHPDEVSNYVVGDASSKGRSSFSHDSSDDYKFKVPQLYNLKDSPFYGHGASMRSVRAVIEYKNDAIPENPEVPQNQLSAHFQPLGLTDSEIDALVAFVEDGLYDPDLQRYVPTHIKSGQCFPNNDRQSRIDLGCE